MSTEDHSPIVAPDGLSAWPSPARMWHYLLGGKDFQRIDREAADSMAAAFPEIVDVARHAREYLTRAVRFVAAEAGVRQFLDLGCGLPAPSTHANVHEIVQLSHPDGRVVYVDSDKVVLAHARALLTPTTPDGVCAYVDSDVREIDAVLREAGETLDFTEPVGVLMLGILGAITYDDARRVVERVVAAIPPGSYLIFEDGDDNNPAAQEGGQRRHESGVDQYELRSLDQMRSFFLDLEMLEPGLVMVSDWRPDAVAIEGVQSVAPYGCVLRKP